MPATAAAAVASPAPAAGVEREACVVDVPQGDTLKVRSGPGPQNALRYGYQPGTCGVKITGPCTADGWCPVEYRSYQGWAEQRYLK